METIPEVKLCSRCKRAPRAKQCKSSWRKDGKPTYSSYCSACKDDPYKAHRKDICDFCGFKAIHICQIDVDHKDGNHKNNDISNLQSLCANCHRLKTQMNKDYLKTQS